MCLSSFLSDPTIIIELIPTTPCYFFHQVFSLTLILWSSSRCLLASPLNLSGFSLTRWTNLNLDVDFQWSTIVVSCPFLLLVCRFYLANFMIVSWSSLLLFPWSHKPVPLVESCLDPLPLLQLIFTFVPLHIDIDPNMWDSLVLYSSI